MLCFKQKLTVHRGNLLADASLFDPDLKVVGVENYIRTFNHLYDHQYRYEQDTTRRNKSRRCDESDIDEYGRNISLRRPDIASVKAQGYPPNDLQMFLDCKERIVSHPNLLEMCNLGASMTAAYSWTKHSHDRKTDERYRKLERRAATLVEDWDDEGQTHDGEPANVHGARMRFELEVVLKSTRTILKEVSKKGHLGANGGVRDS